MKPSSFVILIATFVSGVPIPLPQPSSTSGLLSDKPTKATPKLRSKRQWPDLSWYQAWYNPTPSAPVDEPHWINPPVNPFEICETEGGKKLGAQCSGGSVTETSSDGYYNQRTDISYTAWTIGPPDKVAFNPFAASPQTNRVGTVGTGGIGGGVRTPIGTGDTTSPVIPNTNPINRATSPVNRGGTATTKGSTGGANKPVSGCLDLLGFATVGNTC